jgi:carbamoylphosphate synthase small subunit
MPTTRRQANLEEMVHNDQSANDDDQGATVGEKRDEPEKEYASKDVTSETDEAEPPAKRKKTTEDDNEKPQSDSKEGDSGIKEDIIEQMHQTGMSHEVLPFRHNALLNLHCWLRYD